MILPLIAGAVAAVGIGAQIFGTLSAADAAKEEARAMRRGALAEQKNVDKQNKLLKEQALAAAKAAKDVSIVKIQGINDANALRDTITATLNATRAQIVAAQDQQVTASIAAEEQRNKQMKLDSLRQKREVVRNALIAAANARSGAEQAGAGLLGSGLKGGLGQISAQRNSLLLGIFQNTAVGNAIFQANAAYATAGGLANFFQAQEETQKSQGEADLATLQGQTDISVATISASYEDTNAKLQGKLFDLQSKRNAIQTQTNIRVGNARTDQTTAQGIASLGSSLTHAGMGLF